MDRKEGSLGIFCNNWGMKRQSNLFGKKFEYRFDYKEIRSRAQEAAKSSDYSFEYQILPIK